MYKYGTCSLCYECEYNRLILTILPLCVWTLYISVSRDLQPLDMIIFPFPFANLAPVPYKYGGRATHLVLYTFLLMLQ